MTDTAMTRRAERPITAKSAIAYGIGDLYGGGSFFLVGSLAMFYLVAIVGMDPLWAGLVPGLGKIWDAVSDPLMGYISDRTKSRFGRRRIYFLAGIVPVAITFMLVWMPVRAWFPGIFASPPAVFAYYFAAFLFFYTILTMVMVPYSALAAEMTTDFKSRNRLTSTRMFFSLLSSTIAGSLAQPIVNRFDDPSTGFMVMGVIFGLFFAAPWIFVYLGTWELPQHDHESEMNTSIFRNFGSIFRNRSFRIHVVMYVCAYAAMDIILGWMLFFLTDCIRRPELFALLLPVLVVTEVLCVPLYTMIANRFGLGKAFIAGLSLWCTGMVLIAFQGTGSPTILMVLNTMLIGAGLSAGVIIPYNILPFVTDVDELISGKKRAGTYAGAMTLIRKMIQGALVFPLLGVLLTAIGYRTLEPAKIAMNKAAGQIITAGESMKSSSGRDEIQAKRVISLSRSMASIVPQIKDLSFRKESSRVSETIRREADNYLEASSPADRATAVALLLDEARGMQQSLRITQKPATAARLRLLFVAAPVLLILIGVIFALRFRINRETHGILMAEIERLKSGGARNNVDENTRKVCQDLTGFRYDDLYRP